MRTERKHWRAAEKFLAASIVNNFKRLKAESWNWMVGRGGKKGKRRKNRLSRRRTDPTGTQTALVV
jgi:hypothetical protein